MASMLSRSTMAFVGMTWWRPGACGLEVTTAWKGFVAIGAWCLGFQLPQWHGGSLLSNSSYAIVKMTWRMCWMGFTTAWKNSVKSTYHIVELA